MKTFIKTAGIASWLQLATILSSIVIFLIIGSKPDTPRGFFELIQQGKLMILLHDDFIFVILIALYLLTFPGLYLALRKHNHPVVLYSCLFTFVAVVLAFSSNSAFSLMYLADQYKAAESPEMQAQYLAAGNALIAGNMWNSTAGYMAGILLQGAGVMISIVMLSSKDFLRITAIAGIAANGTDLIQHLVAPFYPAIHEPVIMVAGPAYILWFFFMGWDLIKLAAKTARNEI
jgi:hypothetical protein